MKRIALFSTILISLFILSSCKEDKYADWKILNDSWLEKHNTDPGFKQTESGLCYKVIYAGGADLRRPNSSSKVEVKYKGKLIDGTVFDSSDNATVYLPYMIKGWIEGITKMRVGGHFIFYIPAKLGYGKDGSGAAIPPHSVLIFDVELLGSDDQL